MQEGRDVRQSSSEDGPRTLHVFLNLGAQGFKRRKPPFGPHLPHELDFEFRTVKVAREIQQVDFELRLRGSLIDRWPYTQVQHGWMALSLEVHARGINTGGWHLKSGDVDVCRRESERSTQFPPMDNRTRQGIGASKQLRDDGKSSFAQGVPDAGTGNTFGTDMDRRRSMRDVAQFAAKRTKQGDIA